MDNNTVKAENCYFVSVSGGGGGRYPQFAGGQSEMALQYYEPREVTERKYLRNLSWADGEYEKFDSVVRAIHHRLALRGLLRA